MAVTWVDGTNFVYGSQDFTVSVTGPAGLAAGDEMLAFVMAGSTVTPPTGWTQIDSAPTFTNTTRTLRLTVWRKNAVSAADSGATFTFTQATDFRLALGLAAARGVGGIALSYAVVDNTATQTITPASATATGDELFLIVAAVIVTSGGNYTLPDGFSAWGFNDNSDLRILGARKAFSTGQSNTGSVSFPRQTGSPTNNGLGTVTVRFSGATPGAIVSDPGPLRQPAVLSRLGAGVLAQARADSALGPVGFLANHFIRSTVSDPGPLRAPAAVARTFPRSMMAAASPLAMVSARAFHDFTAQLEAAGAITYYACNLVDGSVVARVPISSWQGTLQTAGAAYLQAVIPAVASTAAMIAALSSGAVFVIYRGARLPDGTAIEQEMARSLIDTTQFDQGPQRYTCTISGYSDAIAPPTSAYPATDRTLRGVRSISSGAGGVRVRCAVDWFLRPGQIAIAGGVPFVAGYLNYYALTGDSYMDVGESAA